jgi:hypothetical protein
MSKSLVLFFLFSLFFPSKVLAQTLTESLGIAHHISIEGRDENSLEDGMIVSYREEQYSLSNEAYDKGLFGVVSKTPAFEFDLGDSEQTIPVLKTGSAPVMVTASNGAIKKGSLITSSSQDGVGMLANKTGFTLGIAQEEFNPEDPNQVGTVLVTIDIKFSFNEDSPDSEKIGRRLLDVVSLSAIAAIEEPIVAFRYIVAAVILIGSIVFGLLSFGRVAQKGIDALGRNPLASQAIHFGILLNVFVSITIVAAGVMLSYLIIII